MTARSRLVAANTRTFSRRGLLSPTRSITRSSRKRSSLAWDESDSSPISSRNRVPPSALSNFPARSRTAPVKAPRTWPNTSDSNSDSARAVHVTSTNGPAARPESRCRARASEVLPVPVSPVNSTDASPFANLPTRRCKSSMTGDVTPRNQASTPSSAVVTALRSRRFSRRRSTTVETLRIRCSS